MATIIAEPIEQKASRPLVQYFDPQLEDLVAPGEMIRNYYGIPVWLMKDYLVSIGANTIAATEFQAGQCKMRLAPAEHKHIGALEVGGTTVEFTGKAGAIQAVLTQLEWKTLRCGG